MKKTLKRTVLSVSILLGTWLSSSAYACSTHDHLCTYHALGVPRTSYDVKNDETRLVIYAKATDTSHGDNKTDFDNHVLLPTSSTSHDWLGTATPVDVRPFVNSRTSFGQANPSDVAEWETSDTKGAHVYGSQYQVIFNKNTAQAIHTGDLNGGEKGNTPYQQGCPAYEGRANCEAVVITGNVPSGTYQQQVQMFNFFNVDNPKADLTVGAWATGHGVLVSDTHLDSNTQSMVENNRRLNDSISQGTTEQTHYTTLEGSKSKLAQPIKYNFYNRGFDSHASGTVSWDHNRQYHTRFGGKFSQFNDSTGNIDVLQNKYTKTSFQRTTVGADGSANINTHWTPERKTTQKIGTQYCSDGRASVRCDASGAMVATDMHGSFTPEFLKLQEDITKQDRERQKLIEEQLEREREATRQMRSEYMAKNAKYYENLSEHAIDVVVNKFTDEQFAKMVENTIETKIMEEDLKTSFFDSLSQGFSDAAEMTKFIPGLGQIASKVEYAIAGMINGANTARMVKGAMSDDPDIASYYRNKLQEKAVEYAVGKAVHKLENVLPTARGNENVLKTVKLHTSNKVGTNATSVSPKGAKELNFAKSSSVGKTDNNIKNTEVSSKNEQLTLENEFRFSKVESLPKGYTKKDKDTIIGPTGGMYSYTGLSHITTKKPIYELSSGGYYIFDDNGKRQHITSPYKNNLTRPPLRESTKKQIEDKYYKNDDGSFTLKSDPSKTIQPPIDYGHKFGYENRRILKVADELNWTQDKLNDYVNSHPEFFELENQSENRSHKNEKPGVDGTEQLKKEMRDFDLEWDKKKNKASNGKMDSNSSTTTPSKKAVR